MDLTRTEILYAIVLLLGMGVGWGAVIANLKSIHKSIVELTDAVRKQNSRIGTLEDNGIRRGAIERERHKQ